MKWIIMKLIALLCFSSRKQILTLTLWFPRVIIDYTFSALITLIINANSVCRLYISTCHWYWYWVYDISFKTNWSVCQFVWKGRAVCYHVYVIGAHKRTHVDHWNMPNHCTSIYHEWMCVCVWQQWGQLLLGILHKMWCRPVCSPGSWSGRGWLPLILVWHRVVVGLSCSYCKAQLIGTRCSY